MIEAQPDAAALLLEGMLGRIVEEWWLSHGEAPKDVAVALRLIERREPLFGWRLRLALRAPSSRARLEHCAVLLAMLSEAGPWALEDDEDHSHTEFAECGELSEDIAHQ